MATPSTKQTEITTDETGASIVRINPKKVVLQYDGFAYRHLAVRLPEGATADCLKDPNIWARVQQASGVSLRRHDHVYAMAHDDTWVAEALVIDADRIKAVLATPRITRFGDRYSSLFSDDKYRLHWVGTGILVQRKSDLVTMGGPFVNEELAMAALQRLYPKVAA